MVCNCQTIVYITTVDRTVCSEFNDISIIVGRDPVFTRMKQLLNDFFRIEHLFECNSNCQTMVNIYNDSCEMFARSLMIFQLSVEISFQ